MIVRGALYLLLLPALRAAEPDFATVIHPILAGRCVVCHGGAKPQAGLNLETREGMLKGGKSGPVVILGSGSESLLVQRLSGHGGSRMPMTGESLTADQVAAMSAWIDAKAPWPAMTAAPDTGWVAPLHPRNVTPPASHETNMIDRFLPSEGAVVNDGVFARRVYYDAIGMPPAAAEIQAFMEDRRPDKRERLVDRLLANSKAYAEHWISFWNDMLRNDQGVNYAGTRKSITGWLLPALESNMPYNRMVGALVNPVAKEDPDGFLQGVNWRGAVNASQTPFIQAAQNTAQVFLGVNLKCASCHDSFINRYKLRQSYALAAMFSEENSLELVRCDLKTGVRAGPEFLFPELGAVPVNATLADRHAAAERLFNSPENGRLARTIVNRYWQRLIGRGLVEPVDDMDAEPWNADLLDWLAVDFASNGYDLKRLMRGIMTSRAYQLPSVAGLPVRTKDYVFVGPQFRRLTAEEFADTVSALTGEWRTLVNGRDAAHSREWQLRSTALTRMMGRPIRDQVFTTRNEDPTTLQALELMNGDTLGKALRRGSRRLLGELPPAPANRFDSQDVCKGTVPIDVDLTGVKQFWLLLQDVDTQDPARMLAGWADMELTGPAGAKKLWELPTLSKYDKRPLDIGGQSRADVMTAGLGSTLIFNIDGLGFARLRGFAAVDDSGKKDDIGVSVRFFIFDQEPDRDELVRVKGDAPTPEPTPEADADRMIDKLFWQALARRPSKPERSLAREFLLPKHASKISSAGLEDLLWSLLMHPELQYIR